MLSGEELAFGSVVHVSPEALALERDGLRLTDHRLPMVAFSPRRQAPFTTDSLGSTQILFLEISVSQ